MDDISTFKVLCLPCTGMAISCHKMTVKEMEVLKVPRKQDTSAANLSCLSCGRRQSLLYRTTDIAEVIEIYVNKFGLTMGPNVRSNADVATDDVSIYLGYDQDEDDRITETLGQVQGSSRKKTGASVSGLAEGAEIRTSLEGVSEVEMQKVIDVMLPTVLESREQDHPEVWDYSPLRRRGEVFSVPAATIAVASDINRVLLRKFGVEQAATLKRYEDLDIKKVVNEATARRNVAEATSAYHDRDKARSFLCRICHFRTTTADVINLGCACKLDLGRAHRTCAQRWFQLKGDRLCEICKMTAQNVQLPRQLLKSVHDSSIYHQDVTIPWQLLNCVHDSSINHQDVTIPRQPLHSVQDSSVNRQDVIITRNVHQPANARPAIRNPRLSKICAIGLIIISIIIVAGVWTWIISECLRDKGRC